MNELQVTVQQTPGVVKWNFEDLKEALRQEMDKYKGLVYTDDTIPVAKNDVANLRKLKKSVEDRRKEIKNKCLEPYEVIEKQAKELTSLIDSPIALIDKQVKDYETEQRERRKAKILEYMNEKFTSLPDGIAQKAKFKIYDPRWENATAKEKDWKAAVDSCLADVETSLRLLENTEEEFKETAIGVYSQNLELSAAIAKVHELQEQKERILEAERRRKEEEARRAAEAAQEPKQAVSGSNEAKEAEKREDTTTNERKAAQESVAEREEQEEPEKAPWEPQEQDDSSILIRVYGTPQEQKKIIEYIGFLGVKCEKL